MESGFVARATDAVNTAAKFIAQDDFFTGPFIYNLHEIDFNTPEEAYAACNNMIETVESTTHMLHALSSVLIKAARRLKDMHESNNYDPNDTYVKEIQRMNDLGPLIGYLQDEIGERFKYSDKVDEVSLPLEEITDYDYDCPIDGYSNKYM